MKIENIIEENKNCYFVTIINQYTDNMMLHGPMFPTKSFPNYSVYEEIMGNGTWAHIKNRPVKNYEIDTDFGNTGDKTRIKIYI